MSFPAKSSVCSDKPLAGQHFVVLHSPLISILIDTVMGIPLGYFAISLGQLFKDHRILLAAAFYVGLYFAVSVFQFFTSFVPSIIL